MGEWVELCVTYDEIEAQMIKNILESENIQTVVNSLKIRPYPTNIGRIGEIRILVKKAEMEKARQILAVMKSAPENKLYD